MFNMFLGFFFEGEVFKITYMFIICWIKSISLFSCRTFLTSHTKCVLQALWLVAVMYLCTICILEKKIQLNKTVCDFLNPYCNMSLGDPDERSSRKSPFILKAGEVVTEILSSSAEKQKERCEISSNCLLLGGIFIHSPRLILAEIFTRRDVPNKSTRWCCRHPKHFS